MKKTIIATAFLLICLFTQAQDILSSIPKPPKRLNSAPLKEWYGMSGSELIFSSGNVVANLAYSPANISTNGFALENKMRFSLFFHVQHQNHYNFNKYFGIYTGWALINVGFINKLPILGSTDAEIRQRSYSIGIPLALKIGNMERGNYIALGVEEEYMFVYKRKVYYAGEKGVFVSWFSRDVNQLNPSVFAEIHFHHGFYIRAKSYLMDFLSDRNVQFYLPQSPILVNYQATKSSLAYLSIGTVIKLKRKKHATIKDV
jgi:hypothetical protein